ncbi:MAG TPA: hypothetical protein VOA78_01435 [Candidatus Dormibacteraeota bacterium]|nr:hypothetical protein [Candidatus Dormibacteraeota bacterium]
MRKVFSHPVTPLFFGLCLRLLFVLRFPATSGDTVLYEQMAANWLKHGVYAMEVNGTMQPVDLRMPGYPAYLALVYWLTGKAGEAARIGVLLGQVAVDLLGCLVIAALARVLTEGILERETSRRVGVAALWLAALCPFTANYVAVPLTEVFAIALTAMVCWLLAVAVRRVAEPSFRLASSHANPRRSVEYTALGAGFVAGAGTLFRPETPLLLVAGVGVIGWLLLRRGEWRRAIWTGIAAAFGCFAMLVPWGVRNQVTLNEVQVLAPKNSNLPGELVPYGFMAWEKTWLFRVKDCYLVPWKLNGESIDVETIPARAFDTAEEKQRVAAILEPYNEDLTLTKEEDDAFGRLARERTDRHPLRTYVWLPTLRAATMWFAPRIELLPVSGTVFPLAQSWEDGKIDQSVTVGMFLLNILYVGLAVFGAWRLWRTGAAARPAIILLIVFIVLRTAFLTTLETPEPRYVLECFPAVIALGALAFTHGKLRSAEAAA